MIYDENKSFKLIYVIVNHGQGSRVLHKAKEFGIKRCTVFYGKGTVNNSLLKFLSIYDERKEIILFGTDIKTAEFVLTELNKEFQFEKPNHGIMFSTSAGLILHSKSYNGFAAEQKSEVEEAMYQIITTIVNKGVAEDVIEAAKAAGSKGGTIVNGRGSGTNETAKLFQMEIEPEKEIVLILSKQDITEGIVDSIRTKLDIDKPGHGIIYVQDVKKTFGIYE